MRVFVHYVHSHITSDVVVFSNTCNYISRLLEIIDFHRAAFRDRHVNKACMCQASCFNIANPAMLVRALAEPSRTNTAQATRWWSD